MWFSRKKKNAETQKSPEMRREDEIRRLEEEREALAKEIEALLKDYSKAIGSKEPVKGARPVGTQPNEYSFWHKKRVR